MHIHPLPQNVIAGDEVMLRAFAPHGAQCRVSFHGDRDTEDVALVPRKDYMEGKFSPDRPGRWWVAVRSGSKTVEGCFWVKQRRVPIK